MREYIRKIQDERKNTEGVYVPEDMVVEIIMELEAKKTPHYVEYLPKEEEALWLVRAAGTDDIYGYAPKDSIYAGNNAFEVFKILLKNNFVLVENPDTIVMMVNALIELNTYYKCIYHPSKNYSAHYELRLIGYVAPVIF